MDELDLPTAVEAQAICVRELKAAKVDKAVVDAEVAKLLELKAKLKEATRADGERAQTDGGGASSNAAGGGDTQRDGTTGYTLKCPKGTRDYHPKQMAIRERVLSTVVDVFKRHGAETLDTPIFELRDTLLGKYGEEGGKLVYDLDEQGGERLSLRYDLTVPFARYLAQSRITNMKRYHIGKVYRRDQPKMTRGRYREFFQCDFDIAGAYDAMLPEAECVKIVDEILCSLRLGAFVTKLNHRRLLDAMLAAAGCPEEKFKAVCASVDKLDKVPWDDVRTELVNERGLEPATADAMEPMIRFREHQSDTDDESAIDGLLQVLTETVKRRLAPADRAADSTTGGKKKGKAKAAEKKIDAIVKNAQGALNDMKLLLEYLRLLGVTDRVRFEPSLARGLDYYTGLIYEAVICDYATSSEAAGADHEQQVGVGSVAGGGRYDYLVGMFMSGGDGKQADRPLVPCVGVSIGIERLFAIMESKATMAGERVRTTDTEVFVGSAHKKLCLRRLEIARILWDADIKAEMPYKKDPRLLDQYQYCEERQIPFAVILGDEELGRGQVKLRDVAARHDADVDLSQLVDSIKAALELRNKKDV